MADASFHNPGAQPHRASCPEIALRSIRDELRRERRTIARRDETAGQFLQRCAKSARYDKESRRKSTALSLAQELLNASAQ
ncbi:hypothetical protein [Bradyrhizobium sp. Arg816]|uniref:hypothetical protein n=1 Tax=Bradyrhizobium sp. Arg816 TaxID=2998491 RepID=UPI00249E78A5|nr:hypothetical protein [Bradyrhizobium sp. Arg816]MDI3566092.1 hypothetical protein [Bradyrhizobium sp. Arg816]